MVIQSAVTYLTDISLDTGCQRHALNQ